MSSSSSSSSSTATREQNLLAAVNVKKSEALPATEEKASVSGQVSELIEPSYKLEWLRTLARDSSELLPVVSAMVANVVGYGYRIVPRMSDDAGDTKQETKDKLAFENFWNYANSRESMQEVLELAAWDYYLYGNAYLEITRNSRGLPDGIVRVPAHEVKATKLERVGVRVRMKQINRTGSGYAIKPRLEAIKFRRYAQVLESVAGRKVWFKEFQDPRAYNRETGELAADAAQALEWKKLDKLAHEIVHIAAPFRIEPYGLPAYISNMAALKGDIDAGKINDATFSNNNLPSMAVLVSGRLTDSSAERLVQFAESNVQSNANRSRFIVLEAESISEDVETGRPGVEIKPLAQYQQNDSMFQNFSDECRGALRRSFRLPETLVARGAQISGAVVSASMKLADEQVFYQERARFMSWVNRRLLPELGIASITVELNSPNSTDPTTLVSLLTAAEKTGGLTPRIARAVLEMILGKDLGEFSDDIDPDVPFTITIAEKVKKVNESGANNPTGSKTPETSVNGASQTEMTQQVTSDRTPSSET